MFLGGASIIKSGLVLLCFFTIAVNGQCCTQTNSWLGSIWAVNNEIYEALGGGPGPGICVCGTQLNAIEAETAATAANVIAGNTILNYIDKALEGTAGSSSSTYNIEALLGSPSDLTGTGSVIHGLQNVVTELGTSSSYGSVNTQLHYIDIALEGVSGTATSTNNLLTNLGGTVNASLTTNGMLNVLANLLSLGTPGSTGTESAADLLLKIHNALGDGLDNSFSSNYNVARNLGTTSDVTTYGGVIPNVGQLNANIGPKVNTSLTTNALLNIIANLNALGQPGQPGTESTADLLQKINAGIAQINLNLDSEGGANGPYIPVATTGIFSVPYSGYGTVTGRSTVTVSSRAGFNNPSSLARIRVGLMMGSLALGLSTWTATAGVGTTTPISIFPYTSGSFPYNLATVDSYGNSVVTIYNAVTISSGACSCTSTVLMTVGQNSISDTQGCSGAWESGGVPLIITSSCTATGTNPCYATLDFVVANPSSGSTTSYWDSSQVIIAKIIAPTTTLLATSSAPYCASWSLWDLRETVRLQTTQASYPYYNSIVYPPGGFIAGGTFFIPDGPLIGSFNPLPSQRQVDFLLCTSVSTFPMAIGYLNMPSSGGFKARASDIWQYYTGITPGGGSAAPTGYVSWFDVNINWSWFNSNGISIVNSILAGSTTVTGTTLSFKLGAETVGYSCVTNQNSAINANLLVIELTQVK